MSACPDCGSTVPDDAPRGLCPRCLMRAALSNAADHTDATAAHPHAAPGVLDTLAQTAGPVPRVLLRDTAPGEDPGPVVRPEPAPQDPSTRYRIDGEIARGGMGAVLKGRDPDLGREVALKVLRDDLRDDADLVRRFVEEAQIGGQLQHPGIVPIYELGTFADRRPFFSMKLVKGRTLASLLADRKSPADDLPRFLGIVQAIAQTVAYAHARGVIHRDLKPSNVMVGSFGEVQVMDWGLAKVLPRGGVADDEKAGKEPPGETVVSTARSGSDTDLSRAGSVMGTPSYMAPEQARGEVDRLDERCDVFALGSILCEALTGHPAFTGRTSAEILRKAAAADTADARARLQSSGADAELVALARDCLAAETSERPRHGHEVAGRVTGYLAGVQERLHAAERERAVADARAVEERRKRRWQLGLAGSIAASLLIGGVGLSWFTSVLARQKGELTRANSALAEQRLRAEQREQLAIDAVKRFRDAVAENPELKDRPELESLRRTLLKEPLAFFRSLRDRLQADGDTRPESLARLGTASFDLAILTREIGDVRDALTAHREALAVRQKLADDHPEVPEYRSDLADSHHGLGELRFRLATQIGDIRDALAAHRLGLAVRRKLADDHPEAIPYQSALAASHHSLGELLFLTLQPDEAREALDAALTIRRRLAADHPEVPDFRYDLAASHTSLARLHQSSMVRTCSLARGRPAGTA
ncbi:MAG: serine/threonine-protein kinase, partial [Thermoleophilia bacterium]|nr:serine/threonine-protein kinase [Thermoleophilia bacterium]